jgi:hypothetical protein
MGSSALVVALVAVVAVAAAGDSSSSIYDSTERADGLLFV